MNKVVEIAKKYVGQMEKPNNSGFVDADFERRMFAVGFERGQAWCCYFVELVCKEAYPDLFDYLDKRFSASATATWRSFDLVKKTRTKPSVGFLAVWRYGNDWRGHIGIVSKIIDKNTFLCIEGNTNIGGSREGYKVCEKERKLNSPFTKKGLNLIGFIEI